MLRTNVLLGAGGVAKLADYGLTAITSDRGSSSYTATDDSSRPERWLAPECLEGGQGDEKADVYSFGMLLFEIFAKAVRPRSICCSRPSASTQKPQGRTEHIITCSVS